MSLLTYTDGYFPFSFTEAETVMGKSKTEKQRKKTANKPTGTEKEVGWKFLL